jgi:hypothetical protein
VEKRPNATVFPISIRSIIFRSSCSSAIVPSRDHPVVAVEFHQSTDSVFSPLRQRAQFLLIGLPPLDDNIARAHPVSRGIEPAPRSFVRAGEAVPSSRPALKLASSAAMSAFPACGHGAGMAYVRLQKERGCGPHVGLLPADGTEPPGDRCPPIPRRRVQASTGAVDTTRPCPEFDAMHERYCGESLNGVCAPRRGRMLACRVRRSATWVTRPRAFRGRFISRQTCAL